MQCIILVKVFNIMKKISKLLINFLVGAAVVSSFGGSAFGAKGKNKTVVNKSRKTLNRHEFRPNTPVQNVVKVKSQETQEQKKDKALGLIAQKLDEKKLGADVIQGMIEGAGGYVSIYDVLIEAKVLEKPLQVGSDVIKEDVIKLLEARVCLTESEKNQITLEVKKDLTDLLECTDEELKEKVTGIFKGVVGDRSSENLVTTAVDKIKQQREGKKKKLEEHEKLEQEEDAKELKQQELEQKQQETLKARTSQMKAAVVIIGKASVEELGAALITSDCASDSGSSSSVSVGVDLSKLGITNISALTLGNQDVLAVKIAKRYYCELKTKTDEKRRLEDESEDQSGDKKEKLTELIAQIDEQIEGYKKIDEGIDAELRSYDEVIKAIQSEIDGLKGSKTFLQKVSKIEEISSYNVESSLREIGKLNEQKKLIEEEIKEIDKKIQAAEDEFQSGVNSGQDKRTSGIIRELEDNKNRLEKKKTEVEKKIERHEGVLDVALNTDEEYQKQLEGEKSQRIEDLFHEPKSASVRLSSNNNSGTLPHDNEIVMLPKQLGAINELHQERVAIAKSLLEDVAHSAGSVASSNSFGSSMIMSTNIEPISSSSTTVTSPSTGFDATGAVRSLQDNVESRIEKLSTPTDPYEELIGQSRVGAGAPRGGSSSLKDINVEQEENRSHNNVSGSKSDGVVKHNDEKDNSDSAFDKDSKTGNSIPRKKGVSSGSEEELAPLPKTGLWVKASGGKTRQEKDLGIGAYNSQNLTLTAGMDLTFAENIVIGAAIGNNKIETLRDGVDNKELMRANMFSIYSMARLKDRLTLSGNIGNTWFKDADGNDLGTSTLNTVVSLKYGAHIGHGIILAPKVSIEFAKTKSNVKIFDNDKTLYGTFGVGLSKKIPLGDGGLFVTPEVHGAVSLLMNDKERKSTQTDLGIMNGTDKKLKHNFGGSLKFEGRDKLELDIGYEYNGAKKYSAHQGYLQVKLKF